MHRVGFNAPPHCIHHSETLLFAADCECVQVISVAYFLVDFSNDAWRFFLLALAAFLLWVMLICKSLFLTFSMPNHQLLMIAFGISQNMWW